MPEETTIVEPVKKKYTVKLYLSFIDDSSTWFSHEKEMFEGEKTTGLYEEFRGFLNWYFYRKHSEQYTMYHQEGFKVVLRSQIKRIDVRVEEV